jgi:hypothetical protein
VAVSAEDRTGSVLVRADRPDGQTVGMEVYAIDDEADAQVGLAILRNGDTVALLRNG